MPRHIISTADSQTITGDLSIVGDFTCASSSGSPSLEIQGSSVSFSATSYVFTPTAASAFKFALDIQEGGAGGDELQNIIAVSLFA